LSDHIPKKGIFKNVSLIVDGTDCPIDRPGKRKDRNLHSNGRHKENTYGRYNWKYTIAVQISSGRICAVLGPDGGSVADITSLRNHSFVVLNCVDPLEVLLIRVIKDIGNL
jgi:hypothetical protein